ncbi:MAG: helix-turn-helix domain-containing protein [Alphaproteobacteria bacterium]
MELSQRLHRALIAKGLTQVEAARIAGVSRDVLHKAATRGSTPRSQEEREAVAKALGVSATWLWHGLEEALVERQIARAKPAAPEGKPALPAEKAPAALPGDAYVVLFETDENAPFVHAGHGIIVSPSTSPKLGTHVYVTSPDYSGVAKYQGVMGDDILLVLPSGKETRVARRDLSRMEAVLGNVAGVVLR